MTDHLWDWAAEHQAMLADSDLAQSMQLLSALAGAFIQPASERRSTVSIAGPAANVAPLREERTCVVSVDPQAQVVGFGAAGRTLFGYAPDQVIGRPLSALFHCTGEQQPCRMEGGELAFAPSVQGRRRSGQLFPVQIGIDSMSIQGQELFAVSCLDITQRLAEEEANRKAQARYQLLVEQIPAVTFLAALDQGANEIYIGPQIEQLLGFTQEEWLSNPVLWYDQLHPDDRPRWNEEFARGCEGGGPFRSECRLIARDGSIKWVHGEARVVRDEEGKPLFLQGIAFDITESKLAEKKTREAQDALARNERLAALGQLAGGVAHDLRNPLGAIRNAWYYLRKKLAVEQMAESEPRVVQMGQLIEGELDRCAKIIGELLDFARTKEPYRVATALGDLVASARSVLAFPAETIELSVNVPPELPIVYVDTDQFRQALVNLMQNALEAVDPQTGKVTVRARCEGIEVFLDVEDNGCGIPEDVRERILEPLFTTKQKGTGLGLSIVCGVLERHGGRVKVHSEVGAGTRFELILPVGAPSAGRAPDVGGAADLRG